MKPANTRLMHACKYPYIHILLLDCFTIASSYFNLKIIISLTIHIYLYMKWKYEVMPNRLVFYFFSQIVQKNSMEKLIILEMTTET